MDAPPCRCVGCFPLLGQKQSYCRRAKTSLPPAPAVMGGISEIREPIRKMAVMKQVDDLMRNNGTPTRELFDQWSEIPKHELSVLQFWIDMGRETE